MGRAILTKIKSEAWYKERVAGLDMASTVTVRYRGMWALGQNPYLFVYSLFVQLLSRVQLFVTLWTAARQAFLSFTISWSVSNSCPLSQGWHPTISSSVAHFSSCLQSSPASVFSNESPLGIRWPKYWRELQFQHHSFQWVFSVVFL